MEMEITKTLYVTNRAEWRDWLEAHYNREKEIWLIYPQKDAKKVDKPFEELMKDLEGEVRSLESGDLTLEKAIASFEKGMKLAKDCETKLGQAKAKVEKIVADETGEREVPFEPKE